MIFKNFIKVTLLITSIFLCGCINLQTNEDFKKIDLELDLSDKKNCIPSRKYGNWQLSIEKPSAASFYNSYNIVTVLKGYDYTYAKGIQWIDKLPDLVQSRLVEAFDKISKIKGVGKPSQGLEARYRLVGNIRKFDIRVQNNQKPKVLLVFSAKLLDLKKRQLIDKRTFSYEEVIPANGLQTIFKTFQIVFSNFSCDIVRWTLCVQEKNG